MQTALHNPAQHSQECATRANVATFWAILEQAGAEAPREEDELPQDAAITLINYPMGELISLHSTEYGLLPNQVLQTLP